jgi:hypothetical protein
LIGTATDVEGNFSLNVPTGSYTISASFVGYKEEKKYNVVITSGNVSTVNFELEEEFTTLNEVVVYS